MHPRLIRLEKRARSRQRSFPLRTLLVLVLTPLALQAQVPSRPSTDLGDRVLAEYFRLETAKLSTDVVLPGMTLDELQQQQRVDRRRLAEMLGLSPMPDRTPLHPVIVGTQDREGFRVERLHFQPLPGLYVAANFYLPPRVDQPLPAILYVCGHARTEQDDGVRPGNKAAYHHHGVWFARNGYACLIIDTVQWGEFAGEHHGTYRLGKWWWNNRGYTPAGVEAWTGIRALDYLQSRDEVDGDRLGVTGRSGGGVYSWWIGALDQRVRVAVPVAGITTLKNHVVDGCVEGHCDCMYMVNNYRWDYSRVAALLAPRPLLISNSDKDTIFPLDGVVEIHRQVRQVYELYEKADQLGLQITEGPHKDTQELRVHAFRWFNRFLKDDQSLLQSPAEKCIELKDLVVFGQLPTDERVTTVDEWFVPQAQHAAPDWRESLPQKAFAGWPDDDEVSPLNTLRIASGTKDGLRVEVHEFDSQEPYRLPIYVIRLDQQTPGSGEWEIEVVNQDRFEEFAGGLASILPEVLPGITPSEDQFHLLASRLRDHPDRTFAFFPPRGVGPTEWSRNPTTRTHIRRRFMLLGQTLDAMRIWDLRRALAAIRAMPSDQGISLHLKGTGQAAAWALYASLFDRPVDELLLKGLPDHHRDGITLLNVSRIVDMPTLIEEAASRTKLTMTNKPD